jgi:tetratricopeptide (TPR) repeat protein
MAISQKELSAITKSLSELAPDAPEDEDESGWEWNPSDKPAWTDAEIDAHPLFMTEMPADGSFPELEALQSIAMEDATPESLAANYKRCGNECLERGKVGYRMALLNYTEGLNMKCSDEKLNAVLHSNRAQVALNMKEYARALNDAQAAVALDPTHIKSYWRGATAAVELELWKAADKLLSAGLKRRADDPALLKLHTKVAPKLESLEKARKKSDKKARAAQTALEVALQSRDVEVGPMLYEGMYSGKVEFADGELRYPMLLLYDEVMATDFVAEASERSCLDDHFAVMFPPDRRAEWDQQGIYVYGALVAYLEVYADSPRVRPAWEKPPPEDEVPTKMIELPVHKPLQDVVTGVKIPGFVVVHVFVKNTRALQDFKERFMNS